MMADMEGNMPRERFGILDYAREYLPADAEGRIRDQSMRARVIAHLMEKRAIDLTQQRAYEEGKAGLLDPRVTSIFKYAGTENQKAKSKLIVDMMGFNGVGWDENIFTENEHHRTYEWMSSLAITIAGGSSEVQLNLISGKALGLPND